MIDDYRIGYGRPPKSSRFKKGQSGNPLGSSQKVRKQKRRQNLSLDDLVLENSEKSLRLREGNRDSTASVKEALLKKQIAMALNGNRLALKVALDMIDKAEKNKRTEFLDNYNTLLDYRDNFPARVKSNKLYRLPPPLPHPDDISFDVSTGDLTLTGPRNHTEFAQLQKILSAKKLFLTMLEEQRSDVKEYARQGYPDLPIDRAIIPVLESYLSDFNGELEKRGWLPRIAGQKEK